LRSIFALLAALATSGNVAAQMTAAAAFVSGDFARARTAYEAEVASNPTDFDALCRIAQRYSNLAFRASLQFA
jgi:hypothetical protein